MSTVRPKKYLGQHFLKDHNIAEKIVNLLENKQKFIIEIGPGMGVLTKYIIKKKTNSIFIEIDKESVDYLQLHFPEIKNQIIHHDFLKLNISKEYSKRFSLIGNFPYNISSQIFFKILENRDYIIEAVGMIQKEVAERIVAIQGKKRGILSVLLQTFYTIEYCFTVNEHVFIPPPKVKSAVIKLIRNNRKLLKCDEKMFIHVVKSSFNQRRKTLRNALKSFNLPYKMKTSKLLQLRAEDLTVEDYITITMTIEQNQHG